MNIHNRAAATYYVKQALGNVVDEFNVEAIVDECHDLISRYADLVDDSTLDQWDFSFFDQHAVYQDNFWRICQRHINDQ